jgi:hypothetical protein
VCLLSAGAGDLPSAYVVALGGMLNFCCVSPRLPSAVTDDRWLVSWLLEHPCSTSFAFSGWNQLFITVPSLRSGAALNHPHLSCNTPAIELWEYRCNPSATRTVCYHVPFQGKVRGFMTRDGRAT